VLLRHAAQPGDIVVSRTHGARAAKKFHPLPSTEVSVARRPPSAVASATAEGSEYLPGSGKRVEAQKQPAREMWRAEKMEIGGERQR